MQTVLETHDAQTHGPMLEVGVARLVHRVVIDIDNVVEHAHRGGDGALEFGFIERPDTVG